MRSGARRFGIRPTRPRPSPRAASTPGARLGVGQRDEDGLRRPAGSCSAPDGRRACTGRVDVERHDTDRDHGPPVSDSCAGVHASRSSPSTSPSSRCAPGPRPAGRGWTPRRSSAATTPKLHRRHAYSLRRRGRDGDGRAGARREGARAGGGGGRRAGRRARDRPRRDDPASDIYIRSSRRPPRGRDRRGGQAAPADSTQEELLA